jgi:SAM-dependent methyltransferase
MSLTQMIKRQFGRPTGVLGSLAGVVMAKRGSNVERNRWTVALLELRPNSRVLEIGFGPGVGVQEASRLVIAGLAAGVDHSEVMVRQARRRNADAIRAGRVDLRLGSVTRVPDFGGPFDAIFAVNSMMFWDDPAARLVELRRLLKPGGRIAMTHQPRGPQATNEVARERGAEGVAP